MADRHGDRQGPTTGRTFSRSAWRHLALAGLLALAACVAPSHGPRGPVAPPPPTSQLPTDTQRHRVALLVPLSGPNGAVGQSIANATTLALMDANAGNIRITSYDTAKGAAIAARAAVADGNQLVLGPLVADDVRIAAPIARAARIPVISYSNDVTVAGEGVFLMGYTPNQSISRVVAYAKSKGINRFAALVPPGLYGERAGTALLRAVEQAGGTVTALKTFQRSPAGATAAARALLVGNNGYDAVLIADSAKAAALVVPAVRANGGGSARLLGTELWNTDSGIAANPALRGAWFASVSDAYYRQFAAKYRARFGAAPYRIASLGYDSVLLTIRIAQDWRAGLPFPLARLTDAGGFAGLDGAFRFRPDGTADRALEVQEVGAGRLLTLDPAPSGFGR